MPSKLEELRQGIEKADLSALLYDSLPPVPEHITIMLNSVGGFVTNTTTPMFRIVSGLDPKLQEFAFGAWHRKYVSVRDTVRQLSAVQTVTRDTMVKRIHSPQKAMEMGIIDANGKVTPLGDKRFTILLTVSDELIEYGIPRYIVEKFRTAEEFGTVEEWEDARQLKSSDPLNPTGKDIDAIGEFPQTGRYEYFCNIEDGVENLKGELAGTTYKLLTDAVIESIADMIEMSKQPALETFQKILKKSEEKQAKNEAEFDEAVERGIEENKGRITNMPQIGYGGSARKKGE